MNKLAITLYVHEIWHVLSSERERERKVGVLKYSHNNHRRFFYVSRKTIQTIFLSQLLTL